MIENGGWREDRIVSASDADGQTPLANLCVILADAAGGHAEQLGFGVSDLRARSLTWMLSRFLVRVKRYPAAGEHVRVSTWPSGIARLLALRDFQITGNDGAVIAAATSGWFLVDLATRRPAKPDAQLARFCLPKRAIDSNLDKIEGAAAPAWRKAFTVRSEDIDANDHVTFTSYLAWIESAFCGTRSEPGTITGLEINYLAEVFHGETVRVEGDSATLADRRWPVTVVREADQATVAKAAIDWERSVR